MAETVSVREIGVAVRRCRNEPSAAPFGSLGFIPMSDIPADCRTSRVPVRPWSLRGKGAIGQQPPKIPPRAGNRPSGFARAGDGLNACARNARHLADLAVLHFDD